MGMPGPFEIILVVAVVVLLFGAKKIPELAKGLGQGIKEFKNASKEVHKSIEEEKTSAKPYSDKDS